MPAQQLYRWAFTIQFTNEVLALARRDGKTDVDCAPPQGQVETWISLIESTVAKCRFIYQLEKGSENHPHWQGQLSLKKNKTTKRKLLDLWEECGGRAVELTLAPTGNEKASFEYVQKREGRIDGPYADIVLYTGEDIRCVDEKRMPWQTQLLAAFKTKPCTRTIHWIRQKAGGAGKSTFVKYCEVNNIGSLLEVSGKAHQLKTAVIEEGIRHRVYLCDRPKTSGKEDSERDMYCAIEAIKNGLVKAVMYGKPRRHIQDPPHVVVFSNDWPDRRAMSDDRWVLLQLVPNAAGQWCLESAPPRAGYPDYKDEEEKAPPAPEGDLIGDEFSELDEALDSAMAAAAEAEAQQVLADTEAEAQQALANNNWAENVFADSDEEESEESESDTGPYRGQPGYVPADSDEESEIIDLTED